MAKQIILSPHIDDAEIGCFSVLEDITDVYYFYECTAVRQMEAVFARKASGCNYNMHFNADIDKIDFNVDKVYAPSSFDQHKDHRKINRLAKLAQQKHSFELLFYSIDMNHNPVFLGDKASDKKKILNCFTTQGLLQDEKYHLFEDIHKKDYIIWYKYRIVDFDVKCTKELTPEMFNGFLNIEELALQIQTVTQDAELVITGKNREIHFKI